MSKFISLSIIVDNIPLSIWAAQWMAVRPLEVVAKISAENSLISLSIISLEPLITAKWSA
jgi:hypothetical protein